MIVEGILQRQFKHNLHEFGFNFDIWPLTHLEYPIGACLFYLITLKLVSPDKTKNKKTKPSDGMVKNIIICAHNIGLCIFSVACFYNTIPIVYNVWLSGWSNALCNDGWLNNETWWYWTYLFYLSKYYEFVDTYILVWKGRDPSFLQKFHHIGAVAGMWIIITSKSHTGYIFVVPNSFIHSIMYLYYALSVWKIKVPFKYILTRMQMIQFCIGLVLGFIELYHWKCQNFTDWISITWNALYVPTLLFLFTMFYRKTYKKD